MSTDCILMVSVFLFCFGLKWLISVFFRGVFGDDDKPVGRKLMGEQIVVGVDLKYPGRIVKRVKPDPGESHESEGAGEPGVKGSGQ